MHNDPHDFAENAKAGFAVAVLGLIAFFLCGPAILHWFVVTARAAGAN